MGRTIGLVPKQAREFDMMRTEEWLLSLQTKLQKATGARFLLHFVAAGPTNRLRDSRKRHA
jgi:hypothetical protein